MTKDQALKFVMPFGKFKGKELREILTVNEQYLDWLVRELDPEQNMDLMEALLTIGCGG